jgi:hypothetical protein
MVKINIKNIKNCLDNDINKNTNIFLNLLIEKTKEDSNFERLIFLVLKYNILIFEKDIDWKIKNKEKINIEIDKLIKVLYDDHIINIQTLAISNNVIFNDIKYTLDKINSVLKKKLSIYYDIKNILSIVDTNILIDKKKKKIINNDIYIEEFSN